MSLTNSSAPAPSSAASAAGTGWYFLGSPTLADARTEALPVEAKHPEVLVEGKSLQLVKLPLQRAQRAPTADQLASLEAAPQGTFLALKGRKGKSRGKKGFTAKVYNPQAARPYPMLTTPNLSIAVTMQTTGILFTTSAAVPVYTGKSFALSQFDDYTSYTSLFDEYMISDIECWLEPSILGSSTVGDCLLASSTDPDDANTPANFADVDAKQGAIISGAMTGHYHKFVPHFAVATYSGAFTSFGNSLPAWLDCASPGVLHYGLKTATNAADGIARAMYLTVRAKVHFRGSAI